MFNNRMLVCVCVCVCVCDCVCRYLVADGSFATVNIDVETIAEM